MFLERSFDVWWDCKKIDIALKEVGAGAEDIG